MDFHRFLLKIHLLGKYFPKKLKSKFKLKFGTLPNCNLKFYIVKFTFSVLEPEIPFSKKISSKNQNYKFKLKFGSYNPVHNIFDL